MGDQERLVLQKNKPLAQLVLLPQTRLPTIWRSKARFEAFSGRTNEKLLRKLRIQGAAEERVRQLRTQRSRRLANFRYREERPKYTTGGSRTNRGRHSRVLPGEARLCARLRYDAQKLSPRAFSTLEDEGLFRNTL